MSRPAFPFTAIVGQEDMKLGLILAIVNPALSGVLIRGEKGTAKSTAVRALASILPEQEVVAGCPFRLAPGEQAGLCRELGLSCTGDEQVVFSPVPVVELPVGATEDRVAGTLDLERALREGERHFEPGLLAAANRGILYVDEVNLLDDHVVDLLLDSAAMGVNTVEREGVSLAHPARFSLVGTMNPEEGELRPQLLDRFGMVVTVEGSHDPQERIEVMERRFAFESDPVGFVAEYASSDADLAARVTAAMGLLPKVTTSREVMLHIANTSLSVGVDGHRADLMMLRAASALAAWEGRLESSVADVDRAAGFVLPHRMRRRPFESVTG
ncbi:ATP-binding protein [Dermatophilus congolensis]|uniref:ATP-binding protein n=1 Tax=Dermatophilus congolensis TaxID=1863 RepID=UPI001AAF1080|nr:ATP-binding protein [Dermatophilus congolensis]